MISPAALAALQSAIIIIHPIVAFDADSEKNPKGGKNPKNPPPAALVEEPDEKPVIARDVPPPWRPHPLPRLQSTSSNAVGIE